MGLSISPASLFTEITLAGPQIRKAKLRVTGLTPSQTNNLAHGLKDGLGNALTPVIVSIEPTSLNNFFEAQAADATNIYLGVGAQAGTSCVIYVEY